MINARIKSLKKDLSSEKLSLEQLFQKHMVDIHSYYFIEVIKDSTIEYKIRETVANALGIHINEVLVMGSAKTGYSLSPAKLYQEFDYKFSQSRIKRDKSDLDIAVISSDLFKDLSKSMYNFTRSFRNKWDNNEYYSGEKLNDFDVDINYKFYEYHIKGWFRPDFKPRGFEFCVNKSYENLKKDIYDLTGRKLGLAIYSNWFYFKNYHIENLARLQIKMKSEIL